MDSPHGIQHIDIEYSVVVLATPSKEVACDVRGGYGSMCPWKPWQRLAAYKAIQSWLDYTIAKMEESL